MKKTVLLWMLVACCATACTGNRQKKGDAEQTSGTLAQVETSLGKFTLRLYDETPVHRDNFIKLVKEGFYDSVLFHRVIKDFMVQAGDPESKNADDTCFLGLTDIGYALPAEFRPDLFHKKGALAAARQGDDVNPKRESSGSQFYIVTGRRYSRGELHDLEKQRNTALTDNLKTPPFRFSEAQIEAYTSQGGAPHLDGRYTVFGEVVNGMDVIEKIEAVETNDDDRPVSNVRILKVSLVP